MNERHGDGDLDVDAAWAEIVAHWGVDGDDVRVVRSGEAPEHPAAETDDAAPTGSGDADGSDGADAEGGSGDAGAEGRTGGSRAADDADDADESVRPADRTGATALPPTGPAATSSRSEPVDEVTRPAPAPPVRRDGPTDDPLLAALDEHFVPAEPPPFGGGDPLTTLAWLGALGGPVFLLVAALAWRTAPSVLIGAAVLAFVAGFVTLVVRMPDRDEDDDGAEV